MKPSVVINEWIEEGRQEGAAVLRAKLLRYLERRFGAPLPGSLRRQIEAQAELPVLDRWFDQALDSVSLEQFRTGLPACRNGDPPWRLEWNVKQSVVASEWFEHGRQLGLQEARGERAALWQANLLGLLEQQFGVPVPADLRRQVEQEKDPDVLLLWVSRALKVTSLDQFRADKFPPSNGAT